MTTNVKEKKVKAVIIEDSAVDAYRICKMLAKMDIETLHLLEAPDTESPACFDGIILFNPSLIIIDIVMPDVDGYDLLAALKNEPRLNHVQMAIMSARDNDYDVDYSEMLSAMAFVKKPVTQEDLDTIVSQI
jgi:CheY-like chemotaxis protein